MGLIRWIQKRHLLLVGFILGVGLSGCFVALPPMYESAKQPLPLEQWKKYGACYEYDELRIIVDPLNQDYDPGYSYAINQKIHILSKKGVDFGTLEVRRYSKNCSLFNLRLIDPEGKDVALDIPSIKQKYLDTGKIVVPNVVPGCQILVRINFLKADYLHNFEYWFLRRIPVLRSRLALFWPVEFTYQAKGYGGVRQSELIKLNMERGYQWECKNLLPSDEIFKYSWQRSQEPHVLFRLTGLLDRLARYDADRWPGIARDYKSVALSKSLLTSRPRIQKLVNEITQGLSDKRAQAQTILDYVRDEITLVNFNTSYHSVDLNKIMKDKRGDRWETALVLKEMLEIIGLKTRLYVTRSHSRGGFDPEFPSWRQMDTPLVAANIDGKEQILYHLHVGAGIGEYPFSFHGLKAIDLEKGAVVSLPKPLHRTYEVSTHGIIALNEWDQPQEWRFSYGGYAGMVMRKKIKNTSFSRKRKIFKKTIEKFDTNNEVIRVWVDRPEGGAALDATVDIKNKAFKTKQPKMAHYSLAPWYRKYLSKYGKDVASYYANGLEDVYKETLLIKPSTNKTLSVHYNCVPVDNDLFSVTCAQEETEAGILLKRHLTIKTASFGPGQMATFSADIEKLNRIEESYIIEK